KTAVDKHAEYNKPRMFFLSVVALLTAGVSFSMRTSIADDLKTIFFDPIDKAHSAEMLGSVLGVAFLGFAFTIAIGSPLLGLIGLGIGQLNLSWQYKLAVVLIPASVVFIGCLSTRFPRTERTEAGISTAETFREMIKPAFLVWFLSMFLTAASELAPGQWVD